MLTNSRFLTPRTTHCFCSLRTQASSSPRTHILNESKPSSTAGPVHRSSTLCTGGYLTLTYASLLSCKTETAFKLNSEGGCTSLILNYSSWHFCGAYRCLFCRCISGYLKRKRNHDVYWHIGAHPKYSLDNFKAIERIERFVFLWKTTIEWTLESAGVLFHTTQKCGSVNVQSFSHWPISALFWVYAVIGKYTEAGLQCL